MLTGAAKLGLAMVALCAFVTGAAAQGTDPRCVRLKDKVRCICALQHGGSFETRPGRRTKRLIIRRGTQHVNEGYIACMRRHGRA